MGFKEAVFSVFRQFFSASGRATRSEYWYFALFYFLVSFVINIIDIMIGQKIVTFIWEFVIFVPAMTLGIRRLHDLDKSGWWLLLCVIPLLGVLYLIYLFCKRGTVGANRFGADQWKGKLPPSSPDKANTYDSDGSLRDNT